jgi:lactate dehydrogenase-like 2-hydroxyacid dehydrogenase
MTDPAEEGRWPAILRMTPEEVPAGLLEELERVIEPIWSPDGTANGHDAERVKILVTANAAIDAEYLQQFPRLTAVVTTGTAYDYVDAATCLEREIKICNTPGYTGSSVAEHAVALFLAACRHIVTYDALARSGEHGWEPLGLEIEGKVAGVIGLGGIGGRIGRLMQAFGMRVLFVNRSHKELAGAKQVDLETLLRESDVIYLALPLSSETEGMIGAEQLAIMKPTAYLINISSDELVDVAAVAEALTNDRLGGAGFDVIGSTVPYRTLPRTVLTPSRAWYTTESVYRRAETWTRTVVSLVSGHDDNRVA